MFLMIAGMARADGCFELCARSFWTSATAESVQVLLDDGIDVNATNLVQKSPIHFAVHFGDLESVIAVIQAGADLNVVDHLGQSALHFAAQSSLSESTRTEIGQLLLAAGADPNAQTKLGETPLLMAAEDGTSGLIMLLLSAGADQNRTDIDGNSAYSRAKNNVRLYGSSALNALGAAEAQRADSCTAFCDPVFWNSLTINDLLEIVESGAAVSMLGGEGTSPLHHAAQFFDPQAISILLDAGAEVDILSSTGRTPLHFAADAGRIVNIMTLLDAGAGLQVQDIYGVTPYSVMLENASLRNTVEFSGVIQKYSELNRSCTTLCDRSFWASATKAEIEQLVLSADDVNARALPEWIEDGAGREAQPIFAAVMAASRDGLEALISFGVDLSIAEENGGTVLHLAARHRDEDILALLLNAGLEPSLRNNFNVSPLHSAVDGEKLANVRFLLSVGSDVNSRTEDGHAPIHFAVLNGASDIYRALLEAGADERVRSIRGRLPIHIAAAYGTPEMVSYLMSTGIDASVTDRDGKTPFELAEARSVFKGTAAYWALNDAQYP